MCGIERPHGVMAGLVPAIHVFFASEAKTWMRGSSPRMTRAGRCIALLSEFEYILT
jgi:hypothetical protein